MYLGLSNAGGLATKDPLRNEGQCKADIAEQSVTSALNPNDAESESLEATAAFGWKLPNLSLTVTV
jgi:hypothetical protein